MTKIENNYEHSRLEEIIKNLDSINNYLQLEDRFYEYLESIIDYLFLDYRKYRDSLLNEINKLDGKPLNIYYQVENSLYKSIKRVIILIDYLKAEFPTCKIELEHLKKEIIKYIPKPGNNNKLIEILMLIENKFASPDERKYIKESYIDINDDILNLITSNLIDKLSIIFKIYYIDKVDIFLEKIFKGIDYATDNEKNK